MADAVTEFFICPNCFLADTTPGQCPNCGHTRVECDPGKPDNPCRKPPMDAEGNITSRAPLWWLARSVPHLREKMRQMMKS